MNKHLADFSNACALTGFAIGALTIIIYVLAGVWLDSAARIALGLLAIALIMEWIDGDNDDWMNWS